MFTNQPARSIEIGQKICDALEHRESAPFPARASVSVFEIGKEIAKLNTQKLVLLEEEQVLLDDLSIGAKSGSSLDFSNLYHGGTGAGPDLPYN